MEVKGINPGRAEIHILLQEYIEQVTILSNISMREKSLLLLSWLFAAVVVATMTIIFLNGWHVAGFTLESSFLQWLGGATIAEVAGLLGIIITALFRKWRKARNTPGLLRFCKCRNRNWLDPLLASGGYMGSRCD